MTVQTCNNHTFVVCAYRESPFLEESIQSVLNQTVKSNIIISTATPNEYISGVAAKYQLPIYLNQGRQSIADDWNFGYSQANTDYVTICHQDDVYEPDYLEHALAQLKKHPDALIFFTDYYELRGGRKTRDNRNLKLKRLLLTLLKLEGLQKTKFAKRSAIALGNAICCPSVTYVKPNLPAPLFIYGYKSNVDWQAWEKLSRIKGPFLYCKKPLMSHRIHEGSETSQVLKDNARIAEDFEMFRRFWPKGIANILVKVYANSEKSNDVKGEG